MTCLMTVRRSDNVITEIAIEGPASKWAHPDGTPKISCVFDSFMSVAFGLKRKKGAYIAIGNGEIMEIIRCVDIEEDRDE